MAGFIRLSIFALLVVLLPDLAVSDLIVLKDGTQVKAQKVWAENDLVRFTLPETALWSPTPRRLFCGSKKKKR